LHPEKSRYLRLNVIYGAQQPGELIYKKELAEWGKRDDINSHDRR
jgi:NAD(P)H-flavin reductase